MEGSRSTIRCDNLALRPRLDYRATFAYDRMFGHVLALVTQECVLEGKDVQTQHETFHNFYINFTGRTAWMNLLDIPKQVRGVADVDLPSVRF
jgi:hypothetical protein